MLMNVASLCLSGPKEGLFYFCVLTWYPEHKRWFLTNLISGVDVGHLPVEEYLKPWMEQFQISQLVVDFPLSVATCETCTLTCPGSEKCIDPRIQETRQLIQQQLNNDRQVYENNPKQYERKREELQLLRPLQRPLDAISPLLSRSFKRRLRKGITPYWNRTLDYWIWQEYYDHMLRFFNLSYDSFGHIAPNLLQKFRYLRRHIPPQLSLLESHSLLVLLELHKAKIINDKTLEQLSTLESGAQARMQIILTIEKELGIFVYENDLEVIIKDSKAFEALCLALVARQVAQKSTRPIPAWAQLATSPQQQYQFVVPRF